MSQTEAPKLGKETTTVKGRKYTRYVVDWTADFPEGRKRRRTTCQTKRETQEVINRWQRDAQAGAETRKLLEKKIGEKARRLTPDSLLDAACAIELLGEAATLERAARFYIDRTGGPGGKKTCQELFEEHLNSKRSAGRRAATIRDVDRKLSAFLATFGDRPVKHVTTDDVETWLDDQGWKSTSRKNYRGAVLGLFNFALKRKYVVENPVIPIAAPRPRRPRPHILTIEDVHTLLEYTHDHEPKMLPYFALCIFAGIRPEECQRLDWKDINLNKKELYISSDISKTHDERWVEISDNLYAWLLSYRRDSRPIFFTRARFEAIRRATAVRWKPDCMRHTYGSYHLALHENAGKTALQMGHRDVKMLFEHYRRAVRHDDAKTFWRICPKESEESVVAAISG